MYELLIQSYMKLEKIVDNPYYTNYWKFDLSFEETAKVIHQKLVKNNPTLRLNDIHKCKNSKEFEAKFYGTDGFEKEFKINGNILKGFFGASVLAVKEDGGVWFHKHIKKSYRNLLSIS